MFIIIVIIITDGEHWLTFPESRSFAPEPSPFFSTSLSYLQSERWIQNIHNYSTPDEASLPYISELNTADFRSWNSKEAAL